MVIDVLIVCWQWQCRYMSQRPGKLDGQSVEGGHAELQALSAQDADKY